MLRRTMALAAMAALLAVPAMAQGPGGGRGPGGGMMGAMMGPSIEDLKKELNLTAEQEPKVKAVLDKLAEEGKADRETMMENMQMVREGVVTRESIQGETQAIMGRMRERSTKANDEIRKLLTAEQATAFDAWLQARAQRRPGGRPGGPPPA